MDRAKPFDIPKREVWEAYKKVRAKWFERVARPRLKGRCQLVRYADDVVIAFEDHLSGKRLLKVLGTDKAFEDIAVLKESMRQLQERVALRTE